MAEVPVCCGAPMTFREVFGIRVFSCTYRNHPRMFVCGDQVICETSLDVHDESEA
jgi:hypothetical protein